LRTDDKIKKEEQENSPTFRAFKFIPFIKGNMFLDISPEFLKYLNRSYHSNVPKAPSYVK
jgi:hypothetical protein